MFEEVKDELEEVKAEKDRQSYSLVSSSTSRNGAQMQQVEIGGGWAMLGLAVAGVAAVAMASANDENSEQRGADRRRRDSSSRSNY